MKKSLFYTSIIVFYWKNKYSKVLDGDVHGKPAGLSCGMPGDQIMGRSGDVCVTSVIYVFIFTSESYQTYFDRLLKTL